MKHLFADESFRKNGYMLCVSEVPQARLVEARRRMKSLLRKGQRRIHFNEESDRSRRSILSEISSLGVTSVIYIVRSGDQVSARSAILKRVITELQNVKAVRLVIESRTRQDDRDRLDLLRYLHVYPVPHFSYDHVPGSGEPLLWIPDSVAWSWGRGGDWRRRIDDLGLVVRAENVEIP